MIHDFQICVNETRILIFYHLLISNRNKCSHIPKKLHSSCQLFIYVAGLKAETNGSHLKLFLK